VVTAAPGDTDRSRKSETGQSFLEESYLVICALEPPAQVTNSGPSRDAAGRTVAMGAFQQATWSSAVTNWRFVYGPQRCL